MSAFRCLKCGAPMGGCKCWEQVTLECPQCGRTKQVERHRSDPLAAVRIVAHCDKCHGEDNGLVDYFDAAGNQVFLA